MFWGGYQRDSSLVEQKPTRQVEASHLLMSDPKQKIIKKKDNCRSQV